MKDTILSLCDLSGIIVEPWLRRGYNAILVDPQHPVGVTVVPSGYGGVIVRVGHVVDHHVTWKLLRQWMHRIAFVAAFPVCTDLAVSGSKHFEKKRAEDVNFQAKAMQLVNECRVIGELSGAPWFFENPVSVIASIYRPADEIFQPFEYGGYLPFDDVHPIYPQYFPPRDAYGKKTCLWTGNGFRLPQKKPVPIAEDQTDRHGFQSRAFTQLGGKSEKTKNIRSTSPRGFAEALAQEHGDI